jgi:hypothetical protein
VRNKRRWIKKTRRKRKGKRRGGKGEEKREKGQDKWMRQFVVENERKIKVETRRNGEKE